MVDSSLALDVVGGRHLVVERSRPFVANDCHLMGRASPAAATTAATPSVLLVTAPNTSGKSTFLRANAVIAILAQAGCFVPAQSCHIGIVVRFFVFLGAVPV